MNEIICPACSGKKHVSDNPIVKRGDIILKDKICPVCAGRGVVGWETFQNYIKRAKP